VCITEARSTRLNAELIMVIILWSMCYMKGIIVRVGSSIVHYVRFT
jgi:hypothetical protein